MKKLNRKGIIALIVLLSIGFAAVSTSLVINGTGLFGVNVSDFDVYFSSAIIDGVENNEVISADGKSITYETKELAFIGDTSVLDFKVTNNSKQYDASVSIECVVSGEKANDYYKVEKELPEKIEASSEEAGKITVTLNKTSVENIEETFTCTINATAIEREEAISIDEETTYSLGGYLLDSNNEVQANKTAVVFSETPHIVTSDLDGYIYVEGLERGSHEIYYMGSMSEEELKTMTKAEIKEAAISEGYTTTSSNKVEMSNNYKLNSFAIGDTEELKVVELKIGEEVYKQIAKEESMDITIPEGTDYSIIMCSNNTVPSVSDSKVSLDKITSEVECGFYSDINTAVTESNSNGNNNYIVVLKDITTNNKVTITKNLSMDINGNILTGTEINDAFILLSAKNVTVNLKDSIGTGKIISTKIDAVAIGYINCEVNSSVNVEAARSAYRIYSGGLNSTMNITGGVVTCTGSTTDDNCIYTTKDSEVINLENVNATSNSYTVATNVGEINIKNSTISSISRSAVNNYQGTINITDSTITNIDGYGVLNKKNMTIKNTIIKSTNNYPIYNTEAGIMTIDNANVSSSLVGKAAVYTVGNSVTTIYGGYYSSEGNTIENGNNGTIYINDAEVVSNTEFNYRGPIKQWSTNNIYINGGIYKSTNGGSGLIAEGVESATGDIYMCSGTIEAPLKDYRNLSLFADSGNFYYSSNVIFSDGTNTPSTYSAEKAFVIGNYTGTCIQQ